MCKVQMGIHPLSISSRAGYTPQVGEWRRQKKLHRRCTEHLLRLDQRNRTSVCVGIYIKGFFFFFFLQEVRLVIVGAGGADVKPTEQAAGLEFSREAGAAGHSESFLLFRETSVLLSKPFNGQNQILPR